MRLVSYHMRYTTPFVAHHIAHHALVAWDTYTHAPYTGWTTFFVLDLDGLLDHRLITHTVTVGGVAIYTHTYLIRCWDNVHYFPIRFTHFGYIVTVPLQCPRSPVAFVSHTHILWLFRLITLPVVAPVGFWTLPPHIVGSRLVRLPDVHTFAPRCSTLRLLVIYIYLGCHTFLLSWVIYPITIYCYGLCILHVPSAATFNLLPVDHPHTHVACTHGSRGCYYLPRLTLLMYGSSLGWWVATFRTTPLRPTQFRIGFPFTHTHTRSRFIRLLRVVTGAFPFHLPPAFPHAPTLRLRCRCTPAFIVRRTLPTHTTTTPPHALYILLYAAFCTLLFPYTRLLGYTAHTHTHATATFGPHLFTGLRDVTVTFAFALRLTGGWLPVSAHRLLIVTCRYALPPTHLHTPFTTAALYSHTRTHSCYSC